VVDIDRLDSTQEALDEQLERVTKYLCSAGWRLRRFNSGTGYNIELEPKSGLGKAFADSADMFRLTQDLYREFNPPEAGWAHVDPSDRHHWLRMVGSLNSKGGVKQSL